MKKCECWLQDESKTKRIFDNKDEYLYSVVSLNSGKIPKKEFAIENKVEYECKFCLKQLICFTTKEF